MQCLLPFSSEHLSSDMLPKNLKKKQGCDSPLDQGEVK
jgi:hypothetical protein